jgi:hypothetical protein
MLSLTAFSQSDTDTIPSKTLPIYIIKMMIKDIISGDQAKEELRLTQQILDSTEKKVVFKDSVINTTYEKYEKCESVLQLEREKYKTLEDYTSKVERKLKIEKTKNKYKSFVGGALLLTAGIFLLIK